MSTLRERKIAKKKEEILRAAAEVFAEKGYFGTTMEEVAAKLFMTKGSMYYYFKNKDDLLFHCHEMIMKISNDGIKDIVNSDLTPIQKLESAIKFHVHLATSEKSMFMVMGRPDQNFTGDHLSYILESRAKYVQHFDKILKEGIEKQIFYYMDPKMVRMIILGALNGIHEWYSPNGIKSAEEISEEFATYLLQMVVINK